MFENQFLSPGIDGQWAYRNAIARAACLLADAVPRAPYSGRDPEELAALFAETPCPPKGTDLTAVLKETRVVVENSVAVWHPFTAAHLHCPPLIPALAAEVILTGLNQSMDSFDQAPIATMLEQRLLKWLCREAGLPPTADGTMTPGGTVSNYTALLLARDAWFRQICAGACVNAGCRRRRTGSAYCVRNWRTSASRNPRRSSGSARARSFRSRRTRITRCARETSRSNSRG